MAVYMIIDVRVKDRDMYCEYVQKVRSIVDTHGGRYLVRGGQVTPISSNWKPERMVIIEFESLEAVSQCFGSEEYKKLAPLREQSTLTKAIVVEGCSEDL